MGGMTKIMLKDVSDENIRAQNQILKERGIKKRFYSKDDIVREYRYFKKDPGNYPQHLFPIDEIKTFEDFKTYWSTERLGETFCPGFGTLMFDCCFGRTHESEMNKIGMYVLENIKSIAEVSGGYSTFVQRTDLSKKQKNTLLKLEDNSEPELIEDYKPTNIQSGLWLCKSWSNEPFWVIFGNVDRPLFLKDRKYVDDHYNNIYRDSKGLAYMMFPLMPIGADSKWFYDMYERAFEMGLREHPNIILSILYDVTIDDIDDVVPDIVKFYDGNEIVEKFKNLYFKMENSFGFNQVHGFCFNSKEQMFKPVGGNLSVIKGQCLALSILYRASGTDNFVNLL